MEVKVVKLLKHAKFNIIGRAIKLLVKLDKRYLIDNICLGVFSTIMPFVNIYMGKVIIDALIAKADKYEFIKLVVITIVANGVLSIINKYLEADTQLREKLVVRNRDMLINEKVVNLDFELVEKEETHAKLAELRELNKYGMFGVHREGLFLRNIIKGVLTIIIAIAMSFGLFSAQVEGAVINGSILNSILISSILIITGLSIYSAQGINKKMKSMTTNEVVELNVVGEHYYGFIFDYKFGKDVRLYSERLFERAEANLVKGINSLYSSLAKLTMGSKLTAVCCSVVSISIVYCFIGYKAYYGTISIGEIMQYSGSITQMLSGIILLTTAIGQTINNNYYFEKFFELIELNTGKYMGTLPVEKRDDNEYTLELKNVTFKYPGTERYVLKNVSMKLNIGEKLAVVGMNGSGKTTFIKLLARLYDPNEGEILLNGINIKKYDYDEYLKLFSVVFQDFKLFSFSLGQNIASSVEVEEEKAKAVINEVGFENRFSEMKNGLETYLYHDFDENGTEISGGEAQKIAMARALYKDAPFVILDEPTAALDPISEFEIYSKFDEIVNGKTAIYISHRLSSCRFCNNIAVFHEGEIIQRGNHDELIEDSEGKYFELWNAQAQYYKEEEVEMLLA